MSTHHGVGWLVCQSARRTRRERGTHAAALLLRAIGASPELALRVLGIAPSLSNTAAAHRDSSEDFAPHRRESF